MSSTIIAPFGQFYSDLLINNKISKIIYIFCGLDAQFICENQSFEKPPWLYLPAYENPLLYFWPVFGSHIIIHDTGFCDLNYLYDFAEILFQYGALSIAAILPNFNSFSFIKF